jgi:hypothetical protein
MIVDKKKIAKRLQAHTGCSFMTALRAVDEKLVELKQDGTSPGSAFKRMDFMAPSEFNLRTEPTS